MKVAPFMKNNLIGAVLCLVLGSGTAMASAPCSLAWAQYYDIQGAHAMPNIAFIGDRTCFIDTVSTNQFRAVALSRSGGVLDSVSSGNWFSLDGSFDANSNLFATWTGPQDGTFNEWGLYSHATGELLQDSSTFGNAQPLATQYVAGSGRHLIVVRYPLASGAFCLRLYNASYGTHLEDDSIDPDQAAITPNGYIIASGADKTGAFASGGVRLCIYDQSLHLLTAEANSNPVQSTDATTSYVIGASRNDVVYYSRNQQGSGFRGHIFVQFNCASSTGGSSLFRSGFAKQVAGFGVFGGTQQPAYVLTDDAGTPEEAFDPSGSLTWTKNLPCKAIAADLTGFYQADEPRNVINRTDIRVMKFDYLGNQQWSQTYSTLRSFLSVSGLAASFPYVFVSANDSRGPYPLALEFVQEPALNSVTLASNTVLGGTGGSGTVSMSAPAPNGGQTEQLSSSPNTLDLTLPSSVTIPEGDQSAGFTFTTKGVDHEEQITITATDPTGAVRSVLLNIEPATAKQLFAAPLNPVGGNSVAGTITVNGKAGPSGQSVTFTSTGAIVAPAQVFIPAGASKVGFTFGCSAVSAATSSILTANVNGTTADVTLTVEPPSLAGLALLQSSVIGGATFKAKVSLNGTSTVASTVAISTNSSVFNISPASVSIPAQQRSATVSLHTSGVDASTNGLVIASRSGISFSQTLTVTPADLLRATLSATTVVGGGARRLTVYLNGQAGPTGFSFNLLANNPPIKTPAGGKVAAQQTFGSLLIGTTAVDAATSQSIQVSGKHTQTSVALQVLPASLSSLVFSPNPATGGTSSTATLTLNGPAGPSGLTVSLASDSSSAHVPVSIQFASGQTSITFTVTTVHVAVATAAHVTATLTRDNTFIKGTLNVQP
jgi:hypothetical protein